MASKVRTKRPGYLYVLVHPSDPGLYKIGVTVLHPEKRLAQHNRQFEEYAGKIVKETGQKWKLKTYIEVVDPYQAERTFWGTTPFPDIPGLGGIEVLRMTWQQVETGLCAAKIAGMRPPPVTRTVRNHEWMQKHLEGTGINMLGRYKGLLTSVEFQCEKGHVFKDSPGLVANRRSCPCCVDWNYSGYRRGLRATLR